MRIASSSWDSPALILASRIRSPEILHFPSSEYSRTAVASAVSIIFRIFCIDDTTAA